MIDELRAMAIFAEVAEAGSFRTAASNLGLSPPVVSYHVSQLESRLGIALVYRSTRKLTLTHEGEILLRHALDMLNSANLGLNEVSVSSLVPPGKLTITLPTALTRSPLTQRLAEFCKDFSRIEVQIRYTDIRLDLVEHGIDLAIRAGDMEDSNLKGRRLGAIARKLVCTPDYQAGHSIPQEPRDLESWNWIRLSMLPDERRLRRQKRSQRVKFNVQVTVDNVEAMTQLCIQGLGLATPPVYLVDDALANGNLVEVLPEWRVDPIPIHAVWHINVTKGSNVRRLLDYLFQD